MGNKLNDGQKAAIGGFFLFAFFVALGRWYNRVMESYERCEYPVVVTTRRFILCLGTLWMLGSCAASLDPESRAKREAERAAAKTPTTQVVTATAPPPVATKTYALPEYARASLGVVLLDQVESNGLMLVEPRVVEYMLSPNAVDQEMINQLTPLERVSLMSYDPQFAKGVSDKEAEVFSENVMRRLKMHLASLKYNLDQGMPRPEVRKLGGLYGTPQVQDEMMVTCRDQWLKWCGGSNPDLAQEEVIDTSKYSLAN